MKAQMLTREYQSGQDFQTTAMPFRESFCGYEPVELKEFADSFVGALTAFGICELFERQSDRAEALNLYSGYENYNGDLGTRQNEKGLELLASAIDFFQQFKAVVEEEDPGTDDDITEALNGFRRDFLDIVLGYEVKASDVTSINAALVEVANIAVAEGEMGVINFVEQKLSDLDTLRRSPDRGAVENIPIWKLVGIAIMVGVVVTILIRCINKKKKNDCKILEQAAYAAGWTVGGLLVLFC